MRVLAILIALVLVALPFAACGGGGPGCSGICGGCTFSTDCCDFGGGALCQSPGGGPPGVCRLMGGTCGFAKP